MKALPLYIQHPKTKTLAALFLLTLLVFFAGNLFILAASAQEEDANSSITVTPSKKRHTVEAGKTVSDSITVINSGTEPLSFKVFARPYSIKNEAYDADYTVTSASTSAYQWFEFDTTNVTLQPKEKAEIPYTLSPPANAQPGGHYAVIFAQTQKPDNTKDSIFRQKQVGALTYITIGGDVNLKGSVLDSEIALFQMSPPLTAKVRIENSGNTHFDATVKTTVTDIIGAPKYNSENSYTVLPSTIRGITTEWRDIPAYGLFKVKQEVSFLDQNYTTDKYVIMFPIALLLAIIFIVTLAVVSYLHKKGKLG